MNPKMIAFIDRDGTLIKEPDDHQVDAIHKVHLVDNVIPALLKLQRIGYELVLVSNQDGLGTDSFPQEDFQIPHDYFLQLFSSQGITFGESFICPHFEKDNCDCRKPRTGLLSSYLMSTAIDVERSCVIGDRETDLQLAQNLGIRGFKIGNASSDFSWPEIVEVLVPDQRIASVTRNTNETRINVEVNLDSQAESSITTGLGFFDHMLEQLAKHGGFVIKLTCDGDLHVGTHHTIEDCALALGEAIRKALGNKAGIQRYGFTLPMDDALSVAALDISGRAFCQVDMELSREMVGDMPTEMVRHFFHSLCQALGANLHLKTTGNDTHHQVESAFKATGRCLRTAFHQEGYQLPTTKGLL